MNLLQFNQQHVQCSIEQQQHQLTKGDAALSWLRDRPQMGSTSGWCACLRLGIYNLLCLWCRVGLKAASKHWWYHCLLCSDTNEHTVPCPALT